MPDPKRKAQTHAYTSFLVGKHIKKEFHQFFFSSFSAMATHRADISFAA